MDTATKLEQEIKNPGKLSRIEAELGRNVYGFEVSTKFYNDAKEKMLDGYLTKCG